MQQVFTKSKPTLEPTGLFSKCVRYWPLVFVIAALAGCARFRPEPISADKTFSDFDARSLTNEDLHAFLETNRVVTEWPCRQWDLNALTFTSFYYQPSLAEALVACGRRAGAQGVVGWRDDDLALSRPWGFDLTSVRTPVSVWQGAHDRMVPFAHGVWVADEVPGSRRHLYDGEGHLSLVMQIDRILDDLLDQAGLA